mmetsp:Transcript_39471/g.62642  ORF Transcript_39471/g.62642 Transcript_39471/m.62642 type:complete len:206 (-) Transcript_39471:1074-1691(-)
MQLGSLLRRTPQVDFKNSSTSATFVGRSSSERCFPVWAAGATSARAALANAATPDNKLWLLIAFANSATRRGCQMSSSSPKMHQTGRSCSLPGLIHHNLLNSSSTASSAARMCWNCVCLCCCWTMTVAGASCVDAGSGISFDLQKASYEEDARVFLVTQRLLAVLKFANRFCRLSQNSGVEAYQLIPITNSASCVTCCCCMDSNV